MLKRYGWIVLIAASVLVFWLGQQSGAREAGTSNPVIEEPAPGTENPPASVVSVASEASKITSDLPDFLPAEAKTTLDLISHDGPFPYRQDGVAFQNREKRLPKRPRGYYREYTVETPGLDHRGARRIITGGEPIEIYYYTDDHYDSFREFEIQP